jgi:hypothetical protein
MQLPQQPSMARLPTSKARARCTRRQQFQAVVQRNRTPLLLVSRGSTCAPREMRFEVYSNGRYGERERGKDPLPQDSGVEVRVWCRHHGAKTTARRPKRPNWHAPRRSQPRATTRCSTGGSIRTRRTGLKSAEASCGRRSRTRTALATSSTARDVDR